MLTSIEARKTRWVDFYNPGKPPPHVFLVRYDEGATPRPLPNPDLKDRRIEWAWNQYRRQMERLAWLDDDAIPYLNVYTGTEIFAEAFGCPVQRPIDNMPFALSLISSASEVSALRVPDLDTPPLNMLFEMADELKTRGGPDAVLKIVDIQSPMDIAALIWEKTSFYLAVAREPEAVRELAGKVAALLTAFLDEWFSRYGSDFVAHFPDYYMPKGITLSEDEIGAVSPATYYDLFHPELVELSRRYGGIGIHCCAAARHQWEGLKAIPDLKLLNLCQPYDIIMDAYGFFAPEVPQMHGGCDSADPVGWIAQRPAGCRTVVDVGAGSREEAVELAGRLREATQPAVLQ